MILKNRPTSYLLFILEELKTLPTRSHMKMPKNESLDTSKPSVFNSFSVIINV